MKTLTVLARELRRVGLTPTEAARKTGNKLKQPEIKRWADGTRVITKRGANLLAPLIGRTPQFLMFPERIAKIVGKVGASSEFNYYAESSGDIGLARMPDTGSDDTVAAEVDGDSLGPAYNGWVVYYNDVRTPPTSDLYGELCVVGLATGQVLVKVLRRAAALGKFDLHPAAMGSVLQDQDVDWAARVIAQVPRREAVIEPSQDVPEPEVRPTKSAKKKRGRPRK